MYTTCIIVCFYAADTLTAAI